MTATREVTTTNDQERIRSVVEGWVVWRDAGLWDELRGAWHPDGRMNASWFRGSAAEFVDACRRGFERGAVVHHGLGGTWTVVEGTRAIAQTKVNIAQRLVVDGVECDVVCTGRFYDFFELRDGVWRIVVRQPIYEKDRIDPVDPAATLTLDQAVLAGYPEGCRHMLYAQSRAGLPVMDGLPGLRDTLVEQLYRDGARWLAGGPLER